MHLFGFFDVDCLEMSEDGEGLTVRPRVAPIAETIERLHGIAADRGLPLVFTTCCSGRMPAPGSLEGVLVVPLDSSDASWRDRVAEHRRFYLAKKSYGKPAVNAACRAYDMFQDNENAPLLLGSLDVETWIVFGNGFDLCVGSAVRGLLAAGRRVLVLEDVRISSANATAETERETISRLEELGARFITLDELHAMLD